MGNSGTGNGYGNGSSTGNIGVIINRGNGQTEVITTIDGKQYTATFPGDVSISTSRRTFNNSSGELVNEFQITVNGQIYVYTTINGQTTVTNGQGQPVSGPFKVTSR
ncbi:hypothetical protein V3C99_010121 [Haemonchus contortus]